jgi:hypothetical protein
MLIVYALHLGLVLGAKEIMVRYNGTLGSL